VSIGTRPAAPPMIPTSVSRIAPGDPRRRPWSQLEQTLHDWGLSSGEVDDLLVVGAISG